MNGSKTNAVNPVLIAMVGLLVGLIGGYWIGHSNLVPISSGTLPVASTTANCPHTLESKDAWILADFRCPGTDATQAPLLNCHCLVAHGIMDLVKSKLAAGTAGEEIQADLIAEYGDKLKFAGQ